MDRADGPRRRMASPLPTGLRTMCGRWGSVAYMGLISPSTHTGSGIIHTDISFGG